MIDEVLAEVRRNYLATPLPRGLEAKLRAATRRRRSRAVWIWAAAAVLVVGLFFALRSERRVPQTVLSEFTPVPGSEGLPEPEQKLIIRVALERDSLAGIGLAAPAASHDTVEVEFIVGEDGLARAARVVL